MLPDVFSRRSTAGRTLCARVLSPALLLGLLGCAATVPPPPPQAQPAPPSSGQRLPVADTAAIAPTPAPPVSATLPNSSPVRAAPPPEPPESREAKGLAKLLAYADRLRTLGPGELGAEIAALGEPGGQPLGLMQLGLALTHTHQPVDTARALGLFQRVAAMDEQSAGGYRPLARLLAGRLLDQRRLEEALERQTQQGREQQRRIEQLTDRLEAMRAIERSLNRPGNPASNRSRPAPTP